MQKFTLNASGKSIELMPILFEKWDTTEEGQNAELLIKLIALYVLCSIIIYTDCNRIKILFIKSNFKIRIQALNYLRGTRAF